MNRLLWWYMFGFIQNHLTDKPHYANQLAQTYNIDYKTTKHHLDVLAKNGVITFGGYKYDKTYFPSNTVEANIKKFNQIWEKINHSIVK